MEISLYKETRLFKDNKVVCLAQNKEKLYECELNIIYMWFTTSKVSECYNVNFDKKKSIYM